jgi:hypothetical protein
MEPASTSPTPVVDFLPPPMDLIDATMACALNIAERSVQSSSFGPTDGSWIVIVGAGKERASALADAIATVTAREGDDPVRRALHERVAELEAQAGAAPDLLLTAERVMALTGDESEADQDAAHEALRAAVAKARGRS